jgi:hypothetical protein
MRMGWKKTANKPFFKVTPGLSECFAGPRCMGGVPARVINLSVKQDHIVIENGYSIIRTDS